jgi:hypothetical protein
MTNSGEEPASNDDYWAVRVVPAGQSAGFVAEVYKERALSIEVQEPSLQTIPGQWLYSTSYRTLTVFATRAEALEIGERMRAFLDYINSR